MDRNDRKAYKAAWISNKRKKNQSNSKKARRRFESSSEDDIASSSEEVHCQPRIDPTVVDTNGKKVESLPTHSEVQETIVKANTDSKTYIVPQQPKNLDTSSQSSAANKIDDTGLLGKSCLSDDLADWALQFNITHAALDALLVKLRTHIHTGSDSNANPFERDHLPKTARTLLKTPVSVPCSTISGMQYTYFGFSEQLTKIAEKLSVNELSLSLNIDGLPLFKSTSASLWPILCKVDNIEHPTVFPVALTYGTHKPDDLEFLKAAVEELKNLSRNGLQVDKRTVRVTLCQVICDAPAKAMVKAVKQFNGYSGCDKCTVVGTHVQGRMLFMEMNCLPRTNKSLREKQDAEHHTGTSIFCDLDLDLATGFPIDYMHAVCLGVMKKLLSAWFVQQKGTSRLPTAQRELVNKRLLKLRPFTPSDFQRKPRTLSEISRFKATELRTFLLYTGKLVLKDVLSNDKYYHFLAFSIAIRLLLTSKPSHEQIDLASTLLTDFVSKCESLYGQNFLIYNVHSLTHLASQVRQSGNLNQQSAFPFENYMQEIKRVLRTGNNPLVEISKRLIEKQQRPQLVTRVKAKSITTKQPNNCYVTSQGNVVELMRVAQICGENPTYTCRQFSNSNQFFQQPTMAKSVGIHKFNPEISHTAQYKAQELRAKCFKMCLNDISIAIEIIHTADH